jgi:hypothetical protein
MTQEVASYIVVLHGRGLLKTCLAKGTLDDVLKKADACLLSGFEVHVYSLKLETNNRPAYLPEGVTPLQREFHAWDAADEFQDLTNSIVMHCDEHTVGMSKRYLQQSIDQLTEELNKLPNENGEPSISSEPSFPAGDTTGS